MSLWKLLFWSLGGIALASWVGYGLWQWRRVRGRNADPLVIAVEQIFAQFAAPLTQVIASFLFLIAMGLSAGSQFSIVLFVVLSALTISGLGLLLWRLWPREDAESNVFDLLSIPPVAWPTFETAQDKEIREWVQTKTHEIKIHPPAFLGSKFGSMVLEIADHTAKVYQKKTLLSVSLTDILRGLERTAADMKIISNRLPFAGRLTLADFERQIEFAIKRGKWLYGMLLLSFSLFNPGNLLRVFLLIFQKKSPWEHLIYELRGWVYSNYFERLGYHMALIYSHRQPPPPTVLVDAIQKKTPENPGSSLRAIKIGSLATLSFLGTAFYLGLQILNSYLVYGGNGLMVCLAALAVLLAGIIEMRDPQRWKIFWKALLPAWPHSPPPYTPHDIDARERMDRLLYDHRSPPKVESSDDLGRLGSFYGDFLWKLWQACFQAYRHPDDRDPYRASREFYLPQAFAGIELLSRDLRFWYEGQNILPKVIRTLESYGLNLEKLALFLDAKSRITPASPPPSPTAQKEKAGKVEPPSSEQVEKTDQTDQTDQTDKKDVPLVAFTESLSKVAVQASKASFWGLVLGSALDVAKKLAIAEAHKRLIAFLREKLGERLIDIYGARLPASHFLHGASIRFSSPSRPTPPPPGRDTPLPLSGSSEELSSVAPVASSETTVYPVEEASAPSDIPVSPAPLEETRPSSLPAPRPEAEPMSKPAKEENKIDQYILVLGRDKIALQRCLAALIPSEKPGNSVRYKDLLETFASSDPVVFAETSQNERLGFCVGTWMPKSEEADAKILSSLIASHPYHAILLADAIDYGAREQVAFFLRDSLFPALRKGSVGRLYLLLLGVEKLKPLSWQPPYDGYRQKEPPSRKEERIRSGLLAWQETLAPIHPVAFDDIFPIGLPDTGDSWGLSALRERLHLLSSLTDSV